MAVDFPAGTELPATEELSFAPDIVVLQPKDRILLPEGTFPATDGSRLVLSLRPYVLGAFQLAVGDLTSPPVIIRGQVQDPAETAPVRGPRVWGLPLYQPLGLALALLLLTGLIWWFWRRRRRPQPLNQWDVAPPAWLDASVAMEALLSEGGLDRGDTRPFLDGLAGIIRRFVAGRFLVQATGSCGVDVLRACHDLGHAPDYPRAFAQLMDLVDNLRYGPEHVSAGQCRDLAGSFLLSMDSVRIMPRYTSVPVAEMLLAEQAWSRLQGLPWLGATPGSSALEVV